MTNFLGRLTALALLISSFSTFSASNAQAQSKYVIKVEKKLSKGDTLNALKKLNKYIDKHPEDAGLYLKRAVLKIDRGDLDPAMVDLNSYCSINKTCGIADFYKGVVRFKQHDYNGAIGVLSGYANAHPSSEVWTYLALSHMWLQHYPLAVNGFLKSLELNPNQPLAYYNGGLAAFYQEEYSLADSLFGQALRLEPKDTDLKMARALTWLQLKRYDESIALFAEIPEANKHYAGAQYNIGVNYYNQDQYREACYYWEKASAAGHLQAPESIERYCEEK